jgi:hypothetical protein
LVLLCCYKTRGDRIQELWGYWLPEGCIMQWCDKLSCCVCLNRKCEQGEQWSRDFAVSWTLANLADIESENTRLKRCNSHHWPVSAVTQQLGLCFLYCFSVFSAVLLLTYTVACKFWSCQEYDFLQCHPHTGFRYSKLLTIMCNNYSKIINVSWINLNGGVYRCGAKCSNITSCKFGSELMWYW